MPGVSASAPSRCRRAAASAALLAALLTSCVDSPSDADNTAAETSSASASASPTPAVLPGGCSADDQCEFESGDFVLNDEEVIPGMRLWLPPAWASRENDRGELNLLSPESDDSQLFFWIDMVAVKSTGEGHGTRLTGVGNTPEALIGWLTSNPDFEIVTQPAPATVGGIQMTSLTTKASESANYDDPDCPFNPRCADYFTNPKYWGPNSYGIGGDEEATFYIGSVPVGGSPHTVIVALDALNHASMARLALAAQPIIDSIKFPS